MTASITFEADHAKKRLYRRVDGTPDTKMLIDEYARYYAVNPETVDYDVVNDFSDYSGNISWDDIAGYAEGYRSSQGEVGSGRRGAPERRTKKIAYVWRDPMAETLVRAMDLLYRDKDVRSKVFKTKTEATAWLDAD